MTKVVQVAGAYFILERNVDAFFSSAIPRFKEVIKGEKPLTEKA